MKAPRNLSPEAKKDEVAKLAIAQVKHVGGVVASWGGSAPDALMVHAEVLGAGIAAILKVSDPDGDPEALVDELLRQVKRDALKDLRRFL